jgi:hypothetical protein
MTEKLYSTSDRLKNWFSDRQHMTDEELLSCIQFGVELEFSRADGLQTVECCDDDEDGNGCDCPSCVRARSEVSWNEIDGWTNCDDGTSGIEQEYQTESPEDFATICENVRELLNTADTWTIPENGSCHVHVSIPGFHHRLSNNSRLGQCILAELFSAESVAQFPRCLYDRWNGCGSQYFKATNFHGTKFSALHSHSQGSLEFRLFGHAQSKSDVCKMIKLAGRAFIRGYRRFLRDEHVAESIESFRQKIAECMKTRNSVYRIPHPYELLESIGKSMYTGIAATSPEAVSRAVMAQHIVSRRAERCRHLQPGDLVHFRSFSPSEIDLIRLDQPEGSLFECMNGYVYFLDTGYFCGREMDVRNGRHATHVTRNGVTVVNYVQSAESVGA